MRLQARATQLYATARALGVDVTVVDPAATPLEAIAGPRLGAWFSALHRDEGVDLRCGCGVDGFEGAGAGVDAVRLADGTRIDSARTALGNVFAAGDAARGAHWESAARQGAAAAHAMLGLQAPAPGPASFWSDQYATRIQLLGDPRGSPQREEHRMTIIAHIDEHACAAHGDCVDLAPTAVALEDAAVVVGHAPCEQVLAAGAGLPRRRDRARRHGHRRAGLSVARTGTHAAGTFPLAHGRTSVRPC